MTQVNHVERDHLRRLAHGYTNETFLAGDVVHKTYSGPDARER